MFRIITSWILSIIIGSILFSLLTSFFDNTYSRFDTYLFFSIIYSFFSALPLLIIEIVFNIDTIKNQKSYKEYTKAKYITAAIIVTIILIISNLDVNEEFFKKLIGVTIAICYGIPGFILHLLFLKPMFHNKESKALNIN